MEKSLEMVAGIRAGLTKVARILIAGSYLSFRVADQLYAVRVVNVRRILFASEILPLRGMPDHVRGVMKLQDRLVPVLSLQPKIPMASASPLVILVRVNYPKGGSIDACFLTESDPNLCHFTPEEIVTRKESDLGVPPGFFTASAVRENQSFALLALHKIVPESLSRSLTERIAEIGNPSDDLWRFNRECLLTNPRAN
ncbi:MAG TPA: chemotaxis protein CheW [Candidatus Paceibacterota bacterium]|nr:chemotaxis protein CheW [Candidatus Paceibacterota bacterium]